MATSHSTENSSLSNLNPKLPVNLLKAKSKSAKPAIASKVPLYLSRGLSTKRKPLLKAVGVKVEVKSSTLGTWKPSASTPIKSELKVLSLCLKFIPKFNL